MTTKKIGSTIVSFVDGMQPQDAQDIQDCLLYAELQANAVGSKEVFDWVSTYQAALLKLGFTLDAYVLDQPVVVTSPHEVLNYAIQIKGIESSQQLAKSVGQLLSMLTLEQQVSKYLYDDVGSGGASGYQCAPCEAITGGKIAVFVCALIVTCDVYGSKVHERTVTVNSKGGAFIFDSTLFASLRAQVQDAVREQAVSMIKDIKR